MFFRAFEVTLYTSCLIFVRASVINSKVPDQVVQPSQVRLHTVQPGIQIQSGTVSYLVPDQQYGGLVGTVQAFVAKQGIVAKLKALAPKAINAVLKSIGTVTVVATVIVSSLALAVAFTTLVCKYTGVCTLKLVDLKYSGQHLEEAVRAYMSNDQLTSLSNFVMNSIGKYTRREKEKSKSLK